jgi:hypothetical protein
VIFFDEPVMIAPNLVRIPGRGEYDLAGRVTLMKVLCLVDVRILQLEMWEVGPVGADHFAVRMLV